MVDRDIEEALDLTGMKIHRQDAIRARSRNQVRHELCGNRHPWLILPILPPIPVIGNDRRDTVCRRPLEGVNHQQQLHQMLVDRIARRLKKKDILAAHILIDLDAALAIAEGRDERIPLLDLQIVADFLRQSGIRQPGEQLQLVHLEPPVGP